VALALAGCLLGRSRRLLIGTLAAGLFLAGAATAIGRSCEVESAYFCARVVVDPADRSGRILLLDDLRHAYVDLDDPRRLELRYVRIIGDALDAKRPARRRRCARCTSAAAASPCRATSRPRGPGSTSTVLEVDDEVVDLARDKLRLRTSDALRVRTGDARVLLRDEPSGSTTCSSATRSGRSRSRGTSRPASSWRTSAACSSPTGSSR
jgi:hypothetical protein